MGRIFEPVIKFGSGFGSDFFPFNSRGGDAVPVSWGVLGAELIVAPARRGLPVGLPVIPPETPG